MAFATARPNFSSNLINPSPTVAIIVETFPEKSK